MQVNNQFPYNYYCCVCHAQGKHFNHGEIERKNKNGNIDSSSTVNSCSLNRDCHTSESDNQSHKLIDNDNEPDYDNRDNDFEK